MSKFLTEYIFEESRLADEETGNPVFDFKLDIALRGEIALSTEKGNHKTDNLLYLMSFLMSLPKEIYEYAVNIAKEYFREKDVNKLSMHIVSRTPVYYLYYEKVLKDLNIKNVPLDTKKSIFCRYIEDMSVVDINITKELLEYTLNSSYRYLHEISSIYLREVNLELQQNIKTKILKNDNTDMPEEEINKIRNKEFIKSLTIISRYSIFKSPTLTAAKEDVFGKIMSKYSEDDEYDPADTINSFADYMRSRGANVIITEQTLDDNGNMIDLEYDENSDVELSSKLDEANRYIKEIDDKMEDALNMTNILYEKLQNLMNKEYLNFDDEE